MNARKGRYESKYLQLGYVGCKGKEGIKGLACDGWDCRGIGVGGSLCLGTFSKS